MEADDERCAEARKRLRSGLTLLADVPGSGDVIRRQQNYRIRLRLWLNKGDAIRWHQPWGVVGASRLDDNGETLINVVRIDRRSLVLFYGVEGMRVGGTRWLEIAPHLAYGEAGVPGVIPANAVLTAEVTILEAVTYASRFCVPRPMSGPGSGRS